MRIGSRPGAASADACFSRKNNSLETGGFAQMLFSKEKRSHARSHRQGL
jgi:hypothetical protein